MFDEIQFDWEFTGPTLSLVGVFFILNSLYFKRPRRFLDEYFGIERKRALRSIRDHVLGQVQLMMGFVFLITGYLLQLGYQLSNKLTDRGSFLSDPGVLTIAALLIGSTAAVTLALKVFQIFWTRWRFRKLLVDFFREHHWALEKYPATAKEVGEILGVERRKEDSVGEYLERLMAHLEIDQTDKRTRSAATGTRTRTGIPAEPVPAAPHPATPPRILS